MRKYSNLIRNFTPLFPNQIWVSDITNIETKQGFAYFSFVIDVYSRKIVGWDVSAQLHYDSTIIALKMALDCLQKENKGLIYHSDRGTQYCCANYVTLLNKYKFKISMTENGDPLEDAIAERVNGILKAEWLSKEKSDNLSEVKGLLAKIIDLYNNIRPHQSISYYASSFVYETNIQTKRKWKNYYTK